LHEPNIPWNDPTNPSAYKTHQIVIILLSYFNFNVGQFQGWFSARGTNPLHDGKDWSNFTSIGLSDKTKK
jgi:hypothetical protein